MCCLSNQILIPTDHIFTPDDDAGYCFFLHLAACSPRASASAASLPRDMQVQPRPLSYLLPSHEDLRSIVETNLLFPFLL